MVVRACILKIDSTFCESKIRTVIKLDRVRLAHMHAIAKRPRLPSAYLKNVSDVTNVINSFTRLHQVLR